VALCLKAKTVASMAVKKDDKMNKKSMPGYKDGGSAAKSRGGPKSNNCGLFGRVQGKMNGGAMQPMGTTTQPPQPMTTTPRMPVPTAQPSGGGGGRAGGGRGGNAPQRRGMKAAAPTEADIMNMKPRPPGLKGGGMVNIRNKKKR